MTGKREEQLKEITERLEQGVKDLFTSEKDEKENTKKPKDNKEDKNVPDEPEGSNA